MRFGALAVLALTVVAVALIGGQSSGASMIQGAKLFPGGAVGAPALGNSIAMTPDGTTAIVGGYQDTGGVGAAWVFVRNGSDSGSTWTQQGVKLTGTGEVGNGTFGSSVAISEDGNTVVVGGAMDNSGAGAAWVFTRSGETWTQQGSKLTGAGEGNTNGGGRFGAGVALSADGNTALIGGSRDYNGISNPGAVWAFTRSAGAWTPQGAKFSGTGGTAAFLLFGGSVTLSADGNTALVGGAADGNGPGSAWVFTRTGTTWTQQGSKLTPSDEIGSGHFGASVSLSLDGDTALIGAYGDNSNAGAVWIFTRSGATWTQLSKLTANDESGGGEFGISAALSADGNTALVGGSLDNSQVGAAWTFTLSGANWAQQGTKRTPSDEVGASAFGASVAVSSDATILVIGGYGDDTTVGAVWTYEFGAAPTPAPEQDPAVTTSATTTTTVATTDTSSGAPAASGSVVSSNGTTVTWPAATFSTPVTVTAAPATGLTAALAGGTVAIKLIVTDTSGNAVTEFAAPIDLVFPNVPVGAIPAYSHDGVTWTAVPQLTGTTLPAGYLDGWFRDSTGSVHLLTLHATDFGTLAAGSKVTSALQFEVMVKRTLNLNYGHKIVVHLTSSLPGTGVITLETQGKAVLSLNRTVSVKPVLTGKAQVITITLPKSARQIGTYVLTLNAHAAGEAASQAIKIALIAHWNKKP
jgi:hypothetical protein